MRSIQNYELQRNVVVTGGVRFPGGYTLRGPTERLSEVIERAGGLKNTAYPAGFSLVRKKDDLGRVALDLEKALKHLGSNADVILFAGDSLFSALRMATMHILAQKMVYDLRRDVHRHLQQLSLSYFEANSTGDIMSRLSNDVGAVENRDFVESSLPIVRNLTTASSGVVRCRTAWSAARMAGVGLLAAWFGAATPLSATETERFPWKVGAAFDRQLSLPVRVTWQDVPLRPALQQLAAAQRVANLLVRRIDPQQRVTLQLAGDSLLPSLRKMTQSRGWTVSVLSPVLYIGPVETASKLATLMALRRQQLEALPAPRRRAWQRVTPVGWSELTEPRALVSEWLQDARISAAGLDRIPHDLWAVQPLAALDLLQRLVLVLAGFELTVEIGDEGSCRIVDLPAKVELSRQYELRDGQRSAWPEVQRQLADHVTWHWGS